MGLEEGGDGAAVVKKCPVDTFLPGEEVCIVHSENSCSNELDAYGQKAANGCLAIAYVFGGSMIV